jgi:hypothetical protein
VSIQFHPPVHKHNIRSSLEKVSDQASRTESITGKIIALYMLDSLDRDWL